jgi:heme oxygenase
MRLIDRLSAETVPFHAEADEDTRAMLGATEAADYRRFLIRTYGFICPVERAIANVPGIEKYLDPRRLRKHELLRRDLSGFQMTSDQIGRIAQCPVPLLETPQEALGWAYPIERAALRHTQLFHHLAAVIPGAVVFTSSYLKCYFGAVGEAWKSYGQALDAVGEKPQQVRRVVEAARAAFRHHRSWRLFADQLAAIPPPPPPSWSVAGLGDDQAPAAAQAPSSRQSSSVERSPSNSATRLVCPASNAAT